ncbi:MAG: NAD(P)H-dependent oxidoreductase subunit E [Solobacterium sp.]|nr:NAD(P)H-dependent oxidoreductase subunit E [Solobacterium sp.]
MERLNKSTLDLLDTIVAKHKDEPGPVIVMLHEVQDELGYIPFEAMEKISAATGTSPADVFGVVNFYAQFTTQPKGKHVINVCLGTACYVKGAQALIDEVINLTGANVNQTSEDGIFSLDATRCLGACGLAPVVVIDGRVIGNATTDKIQAEVKTLINQEKQNAEMRA